MLRERLGFGLFETKTLWTLAGALVNDPDEIGL